MEQSEKKVTLQGVKLHAGQIGAMKGILNSNAMYHCIVAPRQSGKSMFALQALLYFAVNFKGSKVMWCSPTYAQASKTYKEMLIGIDNSGLIKKFNSAENSVILINDSEIYFKSVTLPENLRGYSINYMILDEAAYYKAEVFNAVLRPMLTVQGRKVIICSTPRGKNWFYNLYLKGIDPNEPRYASYRFTSEQNPFANLDEIADAKKFLPENIFKQEYLAEFIEDGGSVFNGIEKVSLIEKWPDVIEGEVYYIGVDIAITNDFFVVTVMNRRGDVVYIYRDNKKDMTFMMRQLEIILKKYNPRSTMIEVNGIGLGIYDMMRKLHMSISPFTTTNDTKQEIIEDLIFAIQEGQVKLPTRELFPELTEEANDFTYTYSVKSRKVIYGAVQGSHDDCVISLCLCNYARKKGLNKGIYAIA